MDGRHRSAAPAAPGPTQAKPHRGPVAKPAGCFSDSGDLRPNAIAMSWLGRNARTALAQPRVLPSYLQWLLSKNLGLAGREARMVTGLRWGGFASFGDYLSQRSAPSPAIKAFVQHVMQDGVVVFDVGANLGSFSLYVSSCGLGRAELFAFEPIPETFEGLEANLKRCGVPAHCYRLALGGEVCAEVGFVVPAGGPATAAVRARGADRGGSVAMARMTTIDRFMNENGVPCVDLLKLDVEGYEINVLLGAEATIRGGRLGAMCLEVCPDNLQRFGRSSQELYQAIGDLGFQVWLWDERVGHLRACPSQQVFCNLVLADVLCLHGARWSSTPYGATKAPEKL
jgi:FkbM family methyltransferase